MTTTTFKVAEQHTWEGPLSERAAKTCRMFGMTLDRLAAHAPWHRCQFDVRPGDIVYITGGSGAGKTVVLQAIEKMLPAEDVVNLDAFDVPGDRAVIDCLDTDFVMALRIFCAVGLSSVFALLNRPNRLSDGQKYRFRLARALAAGKPYLVADEFCSSLDSLTAGNVAYNVHKFAKRNNITLILASGRRDILGDLAPDVVVIKDYCDRAEVVYKYRR